MTDLPTFRPIASWAPNSNTERTAHRDFPAWVGHPERVRFGRTPANLIHPAGRFDLARWVDSDSIQWGA